MKSQGRVWGQQDSCTVSRKCLGTSWIAGRSLERVWDQQDGFGVSKTSLGTSRIAVKTLKGVLGAAGLL